jgi:hypothetical protein
MSIIRTALPALLVALTGCGVPPEGDDSADFTEQSLPATGVIQVDGRAIFPIGLSNPPLIGQKDPTGKDGLDEVVGAGVDVLRWGPPADTWTNADIAAAQANVDAAAQRGAHSWIWLRSLAEAQPGTAAEAMLKKVVGALAGRAGMGMWKGADEPWWSNQTPSQLANAYAVTHALDPKHPWVLIQAPRGTESDLAPYAPVTDVHGADIYPVAFGVDNPDLHQVGRWAQIIRAATPDREIVMTLQICFSGSNDNTTGAYVMPTRHQERYMIYDAIINGARGLFFYGGGLTTCMNRADQALGWNWTFWNGVLKGLVEEIGPGSPIYPALLHPSTALGLRTPDAGTQLLSRRVNHDAWVILARNGAGSGTVTVHGLPPTVTRATVYKESRTVPVSNGVLTDTIAQWGVHVYHFVLP